MASSVAKAVIGRNSAKSAARHQEFAANSANKKAVKQYDLTREDILGNIEQARGDYMPFMTSGRQANAELARYMGLSGDEESDGYGSLTKSFTMADFEEDPGYAFRLQQGKDALERTNAARGKYFSGEAIKGLTDYNQNSASQEYQSAYNRHRQNQVDLYSKLSNMSSTGLGATGAANNIASSGQTTLANVGQGKQSLVNQNTIGAGNARAAGSIGAGQAWITGISDVEKKAQQAAGIATGGGF